MPTINKRFLVKLILVLLVSSGALFGAHAVQSRRIPAALRQQAERAAEAGKLDLATHYLRQYLEFHPDDVDAHIRLAELLTRRNPSTRGQAELLFLYDKILRLDPNRDAIRRDALAIALKLGRYSDAVTHAEALLQKYPAEASLWQQLGAAQAGLNQLAEARRSYETAITHAPQEMIGYQRLAQLVWKNMDDAPGARDVLNRMVRALPLEPDVYLIRARFEAFTAEEPGIRPAIGGDLVRAAQDLQRVFELDPENAEATILLADIMQKNRNIAAAHALLREGVSLYPRNLKLIRSLSWLELIRGNSATAITVLEEGLKATPEGFDLLVPLADLLVQHGDTMRTAEILRRLEARKAPAVQVKYLKARVAMREGQWQHAVAMIESLRRETVNLPGLEMQLNVLLAQCFHQLGDPGSEEKAYQRVTNADPKSVPGRVGLGNLYLNLGKFEDALRELDAAVQSPYATGAVVTQWVRLKARILRARGTTEDWRKLENATMALASRFPRGSSEPSILRAEVLAAQGRLTEAVQLLRQEAIRRPGDGRLWGILARMTADLSGCAMGLILVDEAQAATGDCVDVRLARAILYAREPGRVRPIARLVERIESWPEIEQTRLLAGLIEVYDRLDDQANVVSTIRRLIARRPADVALWLKLHDRATPGDAIHAEARSAIVKLDGESSPSIALCDARTATPTEAGKAAQKLITAFGSSPTRADVCLALARLKRLTGDESTAASLTERAFLLEPTRYESAEALLVHLARTGATERAGQLLVQLASDPRWAGEPFRRLVGHVLRKVPPAVVPGMLARCRPLVEREPGGLGWMAETAVRLKQPEALTLLDDAINRPGTTPDDWLRKAIFVSKENASAGEELISAAKGKFRVPAYAALVAVYCDTAAGSTYIPSATTPDEKRALAQARLSVKLSRSQPTEAAKVLDAFLAEKDITPADANWARRNLSMIYAIGGKPDDRVRAMVLLRDVTTDGSTTVDELRATASVLTTLARYLEGVDRIAVLKKAIVALEAAHKIGNAPNDLFALSQLYRAANDRLESRRCLQLLLNESPENVFYLTAALEELVEDGNFAAARTFADKLMHKHGGDFRAVAAVARFECKAGRPEHGLAVAESYARAADASAGDYLVRSARVAELLDALTRLPNVRGTEMGRKMTDAAVERFTSLVSTRPDAIIGLAGVLAADGRATEAFDRIEKLGRFLPSRVRASAGLAIVRAGAVTDRQAELVQQWLDACLKEEPTAIPLLLDKAEFLAIRLDLAGATTHYQKVLATEPRNVVALNNMAWLLAADPKTAEQALELVTRATRENGLTGDLLDTRARIRITLKEYDAAERDLAEAIRYEPTALRWFHVAVVRMSQTPQKKADAAKAFTEAKRRGIDPRGIHPADLAMFRVLEAMKE
ncbi:MAG: tetratricopeptide repeat protein [Planctomycetia bacterium]|nr:tetratricopeptide repeat protein [Planctomycetia bacterium]